MALNLLKDEHSVWGLSKSDTDDVNIQTLMNYQSFSYDQCDLSQDKEIDMVLIEQKEKRQTLDVIILNAANMENDIIDYRLDYGKFKYIFDVNLFSSINIIEKILPEFIQKEKGILVGISSLSSYTPLCVDKIAYPTTKAALNMVFKSLRFHLAKKNITFITVNPGPMSINDTFFQISYDKAAKKIIKTINNPKHVLNFNFVSTFIYRCMDFLPDWFSIVLLNKVKKANLFGSKN